MNPATRNPKLTPGRFPEGTRVRFRLGGRPVEGEIVEDHGEIGFGGRRLYAGKVRMDEWNEVTSVVPEEDLQAVAKG